MEKNKAKAKRLQARKYSIRKTLIGSTDRPRMSVFRSDKHISVQIINDHDGKTLVSAQFAKIVGTKVAEKAKAAGITAVAFDRNGRRYHGRIKALADAARAGGLQF